MYSITLLTGVIAILCSAVCSGQEEIELRFQNRLETDFSEGEADFMPILDHLSALVENPMDLNSCSFDELMQLGILSQLQAENILYHRAKMGDFLDVHELQAVSGMDQQTAELVSNVVKVNYKKLWTPVNLKNLFQLGKSDMVFRAKTILEEKAGYASEDVQNEDGYLGNKHQYLFRYRYNFDNRIILNVLSEKDPGESLYKKGLTIGPDFNSAYLSILSPVRGVDMLILGDYRIHMGQGLISNASYGGGKSASVMQINKTGKALRPYSSVNEFGFHRGFAFCGTFRKLHYLVFGSSNKLDARIDTVFENNVIQDIRLVSLTETGLHRDSTELGLKQQTKLVTYGAKLGLNGKVFRVAVNFTSGHYPHRFEDAGQLYLLHQQKKADAFHISVDYNWRFKNMMFSGETALGDFHAFANVHMVQMSMAKNLDIAILYRNYNPEYQTQFGEAFGESAGGGNEQGIYIAGTLRLSRLVRLEAYMDLWRYPWLKYLVDSPSRGYEYFIKAEYALRKKMQLYVQYKAELKQGNEHSEFESLNSISGIKLNNVRVHISYKVNNLIELRNRMEWTSGSSEKPSCGLLLFQDVVFKPLTIPISFTARIAYFDIPDWASRIYAYENDLLYAFSIPAYYKSGYRAYCNVRYKPFKNLVLEARVARSFLPFDFALEEEQSNQKTEVKIQMRYSF